MNIFSTYHCDLQEQATKGKIGYAKLIEGLYQLQVHCPSASAFALWHLRLGHTSMDKLYSIHELDIKHCNKSLFHSCDICHLCK